MAGRSAFVIDDSKSARFALRRYLENMHYVVETAESAEIAFTYLKDHHPDVIFLDHVMPGVDGFDVLNTIKSDPKTIDIPVVICSSNEGDAFTQEARFKGAADVITKPPTPQQLARVLSSLTAAAARAPATAKPSAPAPATGATATLPAAAPASAHAAAPASAATPAAKPSEFGMLDRVVAMLEENRAQGLKVIQELTKQVAELKAMVSRLEGRGETKSAFAKFRAQVLRTKPRAVRGSSRRKLPRR
ncbi:MAG TPA: response regulator [Nevskiaceae bacterium]|nr:response regulator [Nevskiaceae bacterium]